MAQVIGVKGACRGKRPTPHGESQFIFKSRYSKCKASIYTTKIATPNCRGLVPPGSVPSSASFSIESPIRRRLDDIRPKRYQPDQFARPFTTACGRKPGLGVIGGKDIIRRFHFMAQVHRIRGVNRALTGVVPDSPLLPFGGKGAYDVSRS